MIVLKDKKSIDAFIHDDTTKNRLVVGVPCCGKNRLDGKLSVRLCKEGVNIIDSWGSYQATRWLDEQATHVIQSHQSILSDLAFGATTKLSKKHALHVLEHPITRVTAFAWPSTFKKMDSDVLAQFELYYMARNAYLILLGSPQEEDYWIGEDDQLLQQVQMRNWHRSSNTPSKSAI